MAWRGSSVQRLQAVCWTHPRPGALEASHSDPARNRLSAQHRAPVTPVCFCKRSPWRAQEERRRRARCVSWREPGVYHCRGPRHIPNRIPCPRAYCDMAVSARACLTSRAVRQASKHCVLSRHTGIAWVLALGYRQSPASVTRFGPLRRQICQLWTDSIDVLGGAALLLISR